MDPTPVPPEGLSRDVYPRIYALTPNEVEAQAMTGVLPTDIDSARAVAMALRERGTEAAIVKMGARGVFYLDEKDEGFVPPFQVRSVDSVAAGGCFNAGLAYGLAERWRLKKSVRFAAACGLGIRNIHSLRLAKVDFGVDQTKNSGFASKIGRHSSILR